MDPDQYCREIESYLCRRNAGHLVRLVGPAFEMVAGWARTGIPIRVACAGIDRYLDRHDAKAGGAPAARRRPVRAEFCEADVLDAFDQWRRAVGLGTAGSAAPEAAAGGGGHQSLRAHLDRVATRLTDRLADGSVAPILEAHLERLLDELSRMREGARTVRGEARQQVIARLEELDRALLEAVQAAAGAELLESATAEAEADLGDFRTRMAAAEYARARDAAVRALLRDRCRLPVIAY
ncbi:MAG TPA: hypothetical protein PKK95_07630 [Vicinamibacterales bacterium]|nr:hypothetical protein [Acidobacteriota bacterium]HOC18122.1 hypothetical protein [Vicinamibacterales bacterium]